MALSIFDDPPTGIADEPTTVKRFASKKLKQKPIGAEQSSDTTQDQLSSMMPGSPKSPYKTDPNQNQTDQDKRQAIRRRLKRPGITDN